MILTFIPSSCRIIKNNFLDNQLITFTEHLEKEDREIPPFYDISIDTVEFADIYDPFRECRTVSRNDKFTMTYSKGGVKTCRGTYKLTASEEVSPINLTYIANDSEKSFSAFHGFPTWILTDYARLTDLTPPAPIFMEYLSK